MTDEEFKQLVAKGLDAMPEKFAAKLDNVAVVIADAPTAEQRRRFNLRERATLFGLYEGVPLTKRGSGYTMVLPDKITIFKQPMLEAYGDDRDAICQQVADTVWHEIAHHFGLDEGEVRRRAADR